MAGAVLAGGLLLPALHARAACGDAENDPMPVDGSLPVVLEAGFGGGASWATDFELPTPSDARVKIHAWFDNVGEEQKVFLQYFVTKPFEGSKLFAGATQAYTCPYRVTAACRAAGRANRMFVAGWSERTQTVNVEEWTLGPGSIAVGMNPTEQATLGFTPPAVRRELIFTSGTMAPIEDMVFHNVSEELLLLEYGPKAVLYRMPLASMVPHSMLDKSFHADLAFVSNSG